MPQAFPRPLERPGNGCDIDIVLLCNLTHGQRFVIIKEQIFALTWRQLMLPGLPERFVDSSAEIGLFRKKRFLCAA